MPPLGGLAHLHLELHQGGVPEEVVICFWGELEVGANACILPVFSQQSATRLSILSLLSFWYPYPPHDASSAITAPSSIFGLCRVYAFLYLAPWRRRVLDLTIASDIQSLTNPYISEYSRFRLLLSREAKRCCAATSSFQSFHPQSTPLE